MGTNGSDEQLNGLTEKLVSVVREALNEALHCTEQADTDLQTLEQATIAAMQRIGEHFLGILIKACQPREPARTIPCNCGGRAEYIRMRTGRVITLVDQIEISRAYYLCEACGEGTYPLDERLSTNK